jgi:CheY-like chemotaxis protein
MDASESQGKILVVDTNLFFVKRLAEVLRQEGFEAVQCSEPAYALTMIEWNMPAAILCASHLGNAAGFEIPTILRADPKTSHIPVIAVGDRGQQSQLEALRAGYADFVDRRLGAEEIVSHLMSFLSSRRDGFHPTQMLARSETALDGRLSLVDLPGVIQVLSQSRQTGGLHINADSADGIIFFDAGEIIHAESGQFVGDDAIVQMVKTCYLTKDGVYKFIPGDAATLRTVQGSMSALILDAMRQLDEEEREAPAETETKAAAELNAAAAMPEAETPDSGVAEDVPEPAVAEAEPEPQAAEAETELESAPSPLPPPVVPEVPVEEEGKRVESAENGPETLPQVETEALPEIEADPEFVGGPDEDASAGPAPEALPETEPIPWAESENAGVYEIHEGQPTPGDAMARDPGLFAFGSLIDGDTLRDLNDLLSSLKVGGKDNHE